MSISNLSDLECSVCFNSNYNPFSPAEKKGWLLWSRTEAVCSHFFCETCLQVILKKKEFQNTCPLCRKKFSTYVPNQEQKKKIEEFVQAKFRVSLEEFKEQQKVLLPTLENIERWATKGNFLLAINMVYELDDPKEKNSAFAFIVAKARDENEYQWLEKILEEENIGYSLTKIIIRALIEGYINSNETKLIERVEGLINKYLPEDKNLRSKGYADLGTCYVKKQKIDLALKCLKEITVSNEKDNLLVRLINYYMVKPDIKKAKDSFLQINDQLKNKNQGISLFYHFINSKEFSSAREIVNSFKAKSSKIQELPDLKRVLKENDGAGIVTSFLNSLSFISSIWGR